MLTLFGHNFHGYIVAVNSHNRSSLLQLSLSIKLAENGIERCILGIQNDNGIVLANCGL